MKLTFLGTGTSRGVSCHRMPLPGLHFGPTGAEM